MEHQREKQDFRPMSVTEKDVHQSDLVRVLSCSFSVEVRQILENRENSTVDQTCVVAPYAKLDACQEEVLSFSNYIMLLGVSVASSLVDACAATSSSVPYQSGSAAVWQPYA